MMPICEYCKNEIDGGSEEKWNCKAIIDGTDKNRYYSPIFKNYFTDCIDFEFSSSRFIKWNIKRLINRIKYNRENFGESGWGE